MKRIGWLALWAFAASILGAVLFGGAGQIAQAHEDPAGCVGTGSSLRIVPLDSSHVPLGNRPLQAGEKIFYRVLVGVPSPDPATPVCSAFDVDTWIKLPGAASYQFLCNFPALASGAGDSACPDITYTVAKAPVLPSGVFGALQADAQARGNVHSGPGPTDECELTAAEKNPNLTGDPGRCFRAANSVNVHTLNVEVNKSCTTPKVFGLGSDVEFKITITNRSSDTVNIDLISVVDSLPGTLSPDPTSAAYDAIPPGGSASFTFTHTPPAGGIVHNAVDVTVRPFIPAKTAIFPTVSFHAESKTDCEVNTKPDIKKVPRLQNLWLCNTGAPTCTNKASGVEEVNFPVVMNGSVSSREPKCVANAILAGTDPTLCPRQSIGSFEFEVRYDSKFLDVTVLPGPLLTHPDVQCASIHKESHVQFRCVTKGKDRVVFGPGTLAIVHVEPTADVYSILKANQLNGIATQLINQDCQFSDLQGHPIKLDACDDAAVTIRYLEGDVHADCVIDVRDQQQIAFRWGSALGSLLFNSRYDLEPSYPKAGDNDVDAKDLQLVYGRAGSTCKEPHPDQDPVDPKSKEGEPPVAP
jgi:hypothetical protein